jgi:glucuronate isomerase
MKPFLPNNFFLDSPTAEKLYNEYAIHMPIVDYHNHLSPGHIADNHCFSDLTEAWLATDHYKWRAMRAHGINESYITGNKSSKEKFLKWAETVPYTLKNPLYHWTHLELKRYFGIDKILNPASADDIYSETLEKLQSPTFTTQGLLKQMNVEVVCTTDDPIDTLEYHQTIRDKPIGIFVYPTFRPDKCFAIESGKAYTEYINKLSEVSKVDITSFDSLIEALSIRIDFFDQLGCKLSDHGMTKLTFVPFTTEGVNQVFQKVLKNHNISEIEGDVFRSALLFHLSKLYHAKDWAQQFHLGAARNNNRRLFDQLGSDVGCDSIGDSTTGDSLSAFLSSLDEKECLSKTILYNLNPRDNALFATMAANFNDGITPGKMQYGASWWFLDQKEGIEKQLEDVSNFGLLPHFIGMLTDSRSFLSYPRHEYFRRILCNVLGQEIEKGLIPNDIKWIGQVVQDICYFNVKRYLKFNNSVIKD